MLRKSCILFVTVVPLVFALGCAKDPETACTDSGGTVITEQCCTATDDYPDTCAIGACGCSVENSHGVKVCSCPAGTCFDGTECVSQ